MKAKPAERVIPRSLLGNASFQRDLKRFLRLPVEALRKIVEEIEPDHFTVLKERQIERLADSLDQDAVTLKSAIVVTGFLRSRAKEVGATGHQVVKEIESALTDDEDAPSIDPSLAALFAYTEEDRKESIARQTFGAPPTYLDSQIRLAYMASDMGDDLIAGFFWSVNYIDSEAAVRSVTFGLSPGELRTLKEEIQSALEKLGSSMRGAEEQQ